MSAVNARGNPVPLILCCADDGEVALVGALDELNRQGHSPEILTGVETDAASLMATVDRIQGPALFVLCQGGELDRTHVRRLSGLFSARRGPEHQLLSVTVKERNSLAIVPQIQSALEGVSDGSGNTNISDGYNMRDVIGPTGVSALRRQAAERANRRGGDRDRIAKQLHEEMVAAERVLTRRKAERETIRGGGIAAAQDTRRERAVPQRSPVAAPAAPSLDIPADDFIDANTEPLDPALHSADSGAGVPSVIDEDHAIPGARSSASSSHHHVAREGASRSSHGIVVEQEIGPDPTAPDARRESDDRPLAVPPAGSAVALAAARERAMAEEVMDRTDRLRPAAALAAESTQQAVPSRPMGKVLLLLSGAGMAALIGLAVNNMTDTRTRPAPATASAGGNGAEGSDAGQGAKAAAAASAGAPVPKDPTPEPTAQADAGGVADGGPNAADGAGAEGPSEGPSADTAEPATAPQDGGTDSAGKAARPAPPSPPRKKTPTALARALSDGRIKRSGKLLFLAAPRETMTWTEADRRCRQRKIGGLGGWRLPTKGQLVQLRRGGYVTSGSFWTRQVVGEDEVYAFDGQSAMSSLWLKVEPNGRSLCARRMP